MRLENAKGTRDFSPGEKILRDKIQSTLKQVCELYGFNPIETPVIEKYETLAAKFAAGDESDALKEIFVAKDNGGRKIGLRFDLTVPFSRYIALNKGIKMPFKKYMAGEVFRDGPIKTGRYRQFSQFDPDIVGCESMSAEAEILSLLDSAFSRLGLPIFIELNNKKILEGAMTDFKIKKKDWFSVTVSIDKLKKIGRKGVLAELKEKGFENMSSLLDMLEPEKTNKQTLKKLKENINSDIGREGVSEIAEILGYCDALKLKNILFTPFLARGLAYYTGPIFEVFLKGSEITSSIAAGGRYDKLIGNYLQSDNDVPAVGVSFGVDVIFEAMRTKMDKKSVVEVFVIPIKTKKKTMEIVNRLRNAGINTDMDIMERGISKNLQYADSYNIPYVLFIGQKELEEGRFTLRDMKTGKETALPLDKLIEKFRK